MSSSLVSIKVRYPDTSERSYLASNFGGCLTHRSIDQQYVRPDIIRILYDARTAIQSNDNPTSRYLSSRASEGRLCLHQCRAIELCWTILPLWDHLCAMPTETIATNASLVELMADLYGTAIGADYRRPISGLHLLTKRIEGLDRLPLGAIVVVLNRIVSVLEMKQVESDFAMQLLIFSLLQTTISVQRRLGQRRDRVDNTASYEFA
ncbi:hypothetical protein F4677DRAFT_462633 [Hypoxylon crocopeplum]|nr:hypothetical protein F4677DRAFT_462633 [Hypoxylon crocopeplum]